MAIAQAVIQTSKDSPEGHDFFISSSECPKHFPNLNDPLANCILINFSKSSCSAQSKSSWSEPQKESIFISHCSISSSSTSQSYTLELSDRFGFLRLDLKGPKELAVAPKLQPDAIGGGGGIAAEDRRIRITPPSCLSTLFAAGAAAKQAKGVIGATPAPTIGP